MFSRLQRILVLFLLVIATSILVTIEAVNSTHPVLTAFIGSGVLILTLLAGFLLGSASREKDDENDEDHSE